MYTARPGSEKEKKSTRAQNVLECKSGITRNIWENNAEAENMELSMKIK